MCVFLLIYTLYIMSMYVLLDHPDKCADVDFVDFRVIRSYIVLEQNGHKLNTCFH